MDEFIENICVHINQYWMICIMFIFVGMFVDMNIGAFNLFLELLEFLFLL